MNKVEHYVDEFGNQVWYRLALRHREDGPAVIYADGWVGWYIEGIWYSFDDYCKKLNLTPDHILELKLKYG